MIFLAGINDKVKDCGMAPNGSCPVCGRAGMLHITKKYMRLHLFFIPVFGFGRTYLATCGSCASVMELRREKGRDIEQGRPVRILPDDLHVIQNNAAPVCAQCGRRGQRDSVYCSQCGSPLAGR